MPTGTVTAIGQSSTGKPQVSIDNQKYSTGKTPLNGLKVGDRINFDSNSSFYNGKEVWFLNGWKIAQDVDTKYPPSQGQSQQNASPAVSTVVPGAIADIERPAISNWVAAAISAGLIKGPDEIYRWVNKAKDALRGIGSDKDIP